MSGGPDAALAAAEAGAQHNTAAAQPPTKPAAGQPQASRPGRFKVAARLVMAMKRFEGEEGGSGGAALWGRPMWAPCACVATEAPRRGTFRLGRIGAWPRVPVAGAHWRGHPRPLQGCLGTARSPRRVRDERLRRSAAQCSAFRALLSRETKKKKARTRSPLGPSSPAPSSPQHNTAGINPTYTYGKRPDSPIPPGAAAAAASAAAGPASAAGRAGGTPPPAVPPGPPGFAEWVPVAAAGSPPPEVHAHTRKGVLPTYAHHGHRASLLTARLPSVGDVNAAAGGEGAK
jgi:hypothetical protein